MNQNDRFIWQVGGEEVYKNLINSYLGPPYWRIRFVQFEGDVAERAEEYQVHITENGKVVRMRHQLPEARPGASLLEEEARTIADSVLKAEFQIDSKNLKLISSEPSKLSARTDWGFTFADTLNYPLSVGEARLFLMIVGDKSVDAYRYIHVPEEWNRQERNQRNLPQSIQILCRILLISLVLAGAIGAIVSWSRKKFSVITFFLFFAVLFGLRCIGLINSWPAVLAQFSTAESYSNQTFATIAFSLLGSLFLAGGFALIVGFVQDWKSKQSIIHTPKAIMMGISLGILISGLFALIERFAPSLTPHWANYDAASSFFPILDSSFAFIGEYLTLATIYLLMFTAVHQFTKGWRQKKGLFSSLLILTGLILTGSNSLYSVPYWLLSGLLFGLVLLTAYYFVFRFHLSLVPLAILAIAILSGLQQGLYQAYPDALQGDVLAVIIISVIAIYWFKKLSIK